jgi:hypothetical protein
MKAEDLTLILSVIQTVVIVFTLVALIWQLRQVVRALQQDALSRAIDDYSQMMNHLLVKPNLNRFFYEGIKDFESLSDDQKDFYNYIALSITLFERIYLLAKKGAIEPTIWESWERWLTNGWFRVGLFQTYWANEKTFYTTDFCKYVDDKYEEFQSGNKPPNNGMHPTPL